MNRINFLAVCAALAGCAVAHSSEPAAEIGLPEVQFALPNPAVVSRPPPAEARAQLETCLAAGGGLIEVDRVNNNDTTAHGSVTAFASSPGGILGVASADGVVKFWTLEGMVSSASHSLFSYGPELPAAPGTDLAFDGDELFLADVGGLVTKWYVDGRSRIVGGTSPGIAIVAVAVDHPRGRIAHAEDVVGGRIMLRGVGEDTTVLGPLETQAYEVSDLAFFDDGRLVIGGKNVAGAALLEVRDSADPARVVAAYAHAWAGFTEGPAVTLVSELAVRPGHVAVATNAYAVFLDEAMNVTATSERLPLLSSRSIELTEHGLFAFVANVVDEHVEISVFDTANAHQLQSVRALAGDSSIVSLRTDDANDLLFAAYENGVIVALSCAAAPQL
ncbi:MAG: hypothetical protein IPK60_09480 [Sandaracinaceae bacterium]|jgi:hypothetical protein|nr:hypothetical protein [Sandaracinaceae bacterium]